jgi:hypothetical protein
MNNAEGSTCSFDECAFNPSPLAHLPCLLGGGALLVASFYIRITSIWAEHSELLMAGAMAIGALGVAMLLLVAWKCLNQKLCFCGTYVSRYSGILGTNLRTSRLLYKHVRGVEIEQSILGRIFNLGDIHVGSDNSRSTAEIVIRGVYNPERIKDILLERVAATMQAEHGALYDLDATAAQAI